MLSRKWEMTVKRPSSAKAEFTLQEKRRKECKSRRKGRRAVKCRVLDTPWLFTHKPTEQDQASQTFCVDEGDDLQSHLLEIDGPWEKDSFFLEGVGRWWVSRSPADGSTSLYIWTLITGLSALCKNKIQTRCWEGNMFWGLWGIVEM